MKKTTSKILSIVLSLFMVFSIFPIGTITANASENVVTGNCGNNITWSINTTSGSLVLTGTGAMPDYTGTTTPWNNYKNTLKSVEIKTGITSIGAHAFNGFTYISNVTIPEGIVSIGTNAFIQCRGIVTLKLPDSLETISDNVFYKCSALTEITIPKGVKSIGASVFYYCSNLSRINVANDNEYYSSFDGVLFNKNKTELVAFPAKIGGSYTVPDNVTTIGARSFSSCTELTEINLNNVETIGISAFNACTSLKDVIFGDKITYISNQSFMGCSALEEIVIPDTVTYLGQQCFQTDTLLKSVVLSNRLTAIGKSTFSGCTALTEITIPASITYFNNFTFSDCNALKNVYYLGTEEQWKNVIINSEGNSSFINATKYYNYNKFNWKFDEAIGKLTIYGKSAMPDYKADTVPWSAHKTAIKTVEIKVGITNIGAYAFYGCTALTSVIIPEGVISIGDNAFTQCRAINNLILPNSLKTIGDNVFYRCSGLAEITLPRNVNSIGASVFYYCANLSKINVVNENEYYSSLDGVLFNKNKTELVAFPAKIGGTYTVPDTVTAVGARSFSGCTELTGINLNNVETIGISTFNACTSLKDVIWGDKINYISNQSFNGCSALEKIIIPDTVTYLGQHCFQNCTSLKTVTLSNRLTAIGKSMFSGCTSLTEITIPTNITYITNSVFSNCTSLTDIYYLGTEDEWANLQVSSVDNSCFTSATVHFTKTIEYCTVNFDSNGGITEYEPIEVEKGTVIGTLPSAPETDEAKSFAGWYTEDNVLVTESTVITADTVLYAHWIDLAIQNFEITTLPERTEFFRDEMIDLAGAEFTVTYTDGSTKIVDYDCLDVAYDFSNIGITTVVISYTENDITFSVQYDVNVVFIPEIYSFLDMVKAGQEITIPVSISGNSGLNGFGFTIMFDSEILTFVDATSGMLTQHGRFEYTINEDGSVYICWNSEACVLDDGEIFNLVFYINNTPADNTVIELYPDYENTYNEDGGVYIALGFVHVMIEKFEPDFDTNGDGVIDVRDLVRLKKIIAGLEDDVNGNANVDGEGDIDSADLAMLRKKTMEDIFNDLSIDIIDVM